MRNALFILFLLPVSVQAIEREQFDKILAAIAAAQSNVYIETRASIVHLGTNALAMLAQAGSDTALPWQQRLAARICYEHIERADAIDALRRHDWRQNPDYNIRWERSMTGPGWKMPSVVVPGLAKEGLWHYYIELTWKQTGEMAISPLQGINNYWPRWCRTAVTGQPEEFYLRLAIVERLDMDPTLGQVDAVELYKLLLDMKAMEAVPILVQRYDAYNKREVIGPELFPGRHAELYRGMFAPLLSFADSRHAELLDKFTAEREDILGELRPRLEDVRQRVPTPIAEPAFRCEKRPPLEGMVRPPPGIFGPPAPSAPPPPEPEDAPEDIAIEVE